MIKFAVTRPKERLKAIAHGVGMLKWHEDPYLRHYGVAIDPNMTIVSSLVPVEFLKLTSLDSSSCSATPRGSVQRFRRKAWILWPLGPSWEEVSAP
jgi:hypothetical protein